MPTVAATPPAWTMQRWRAFGTTAILWARAAAIDRARGAVESELAAIDRAANRFDPHSDISRLNQAGGRRIAITHRAVDALELAIDAAELSGGAVDPTVGHALIELGYDRDWEVLVHVPASTPLTASGGRGQPARLPVAAWRSIELWIDPPAARIPPMIRLDLGATAKALAVDLGVRAAANATGHGALLSLGGDISVCGPVPGEGWPIRVADDHRHGELGPTQDIAIRVGGLATSSLVTRRWRRDGRAVHHILDPRTGLPVDPYWRTVSVAAADCAQANIAATASIVLGAVAPGWLARYDLPARLVGVDGGVQTQGGWPA
jgi:thiamine biosynthesis lipoprotein